MGKKESLKKITVSYYTSLLFYISNNYYFILFYYINRYYQNHIFQMKKTKLP